MSRDCSARASSLLLLVGTLVSAQAATGMDFVIEDGDTAGLAAAVRAANRSPEPDRILLPPGGRFLFLGPGPEGAALPTISGRLDLVGNRSELRRYSDHAFPHLVVADGADLRLVDVALADGGAGAVVNRGTLLASGVIIEDSSADAGASALLNFGEARLEACEIRFNSYAGAGPTGGALVNHGALTLRRTRLVGNTAFGGAPDAVFGAALSNHGSALLDTVTVQGNGAPIGGSGAIANFPGARLAVRGSVIEDSEPAPLAAVPTGGELALDGTTIRR